MKTLPSIILIIIFFSCSYQKDSESKKLYEEHKTNLDTTHKMDQEHQEVLKDEMEFDSIKLKKFWNDCIAPIIQKDVKLLKEIVEFPLIGEWGYMMGLEKNEEEWTQSDFFNHYDILFNDKTINALEQLTYKDIEFFNSEILVGVGWKEDGVESGIIFRFKKMEGKWKLYIIQGIG